MHNAQSDEWCSFVHVSLPTTRYIFLFDKVVIVCKRKGYSYELKEIIELQLYKMSDDPMNNRDMKKVGSPPCSLQSFQWAK